MALHAFAPHLKIIAMSGGGSFGVNSFLATAKKLGAHHILHKPLDMQELLTRVRELLAEDSCVAEEENQSE